MNTNSDSLLNSCEPVQNVQQMCKIHVNYSIMYAWLIICFKSVAHMMIGANVFVALWFAFNSTPVSAFHLHVGLSVIGYQLLISHAILCLNKNNGWTSQMSFLQRMRAHVVLQILGSTLAIIGSVTMILEKSVHFTSIHGKLALAALIFTGFSFINGVISFLSNGRTSSIKIAKTSHLLCGILTFTLSSLCLCYGYNKNSFRTWASQEVAFIMIFITCISTTYVIVNPLTTFTRKFFNLIKVKIW
ncbi:uncharacterized protein [Battus philenor]|uniref:uncharacterized protein n=1 Tax=Battus philenor TaxID=42288 RepID=UPI0035CFDDA6